MVDLGSLVLLMSIFGAKVAVAYVVLGLIVAVAGGTLIERLHMEEQVEAFIRNASTVDIESPTLAQKERLLYARDQMGFHLQKVVPVHSAGRGHRRADSQLDSRKLGGEPPGWKQPFGVILATVIGVPMYADIFGTIPIAEALLAKGAQLGTVLSFMMGVTTLSLPSMIMLRKAIRPKLLALFVVICTVGIIVVGYVFNALQFLFV